MSRGEPLAVGEVVLLIDDKGRKYLTDLRSGGTFQYHRGLLQHDDVIGSEDGTRHKATRGGELLVMRPRYADYVLKMRRGAQIMYPKDIGPLIVYGDIAPGHTVLEAGTGSGALTGALLRAVGDSGRVVSVERRSDHHSHAVDVIERWHGGLPKNLQLLEGEVEEFVSEVQPDRVVLDLPEPWHVIEAVAANLSGGAGVVAYVPTVPQLQQTMDAFRVDDRYTQLEAFEIFLRTWKAEGRSVRPDQKMIGHTGFLAAGRLTARGAE